MNSTKEIFLAACKLEPDQRDDFIAQACQHDPEQIAQVQRLLGAHQLVQHPIDQGIFAELPQLDFPKPSQQLGLYRLVKEIGEGGFGVVFEAVQMQPFQRTVALKVLKAGMDTRQYLRRFDDERRALALLNHPNIAALYDGGSTDTGRPYFVMELVEGQKITEYCVSHKLSMEDKLRLFLSVGQAIEHAHQRGVIHRDLKPSNILVAQVDGQVKVKIIDFGIAKLLDATRQTDQHTAVGDFLGTPMYTSPEQASGKSVDTRSDIYSLGMVLYELIAGLHPHDPNLIRRSSQVQALKYVSQITPKRPSLRISEGCSSVQIDGDSKRLRRRLRHELDAVVMKSISQQPQDRYASVGEFMADIQRFLKHQPVLARAHSTGYLIRKLLVRNKWIAVFLVLSIGSLSVVAISGVLFSLRLKSLLQRANTAEQALEQSNHDVTIQAQTALLNLARSHAGSRRAGQYFDCIDALQSAKKLVPDIQDRVDEYRNIAAAALVLPDLRKRKLIDLPTASLRESAVSADLKLVGYFDTPKSQFCIYDLVQRREVMRLPDGNWPQTRFDYRGPTFSPDSKYLVYATLKEEQPNLAVWEVGFQEPVFVASSTAVFASFRSDMKECAVSHLDGTIQLLDLPSWQESARLKSSSIEPSVFWNASNTLFHVWEKTGVVVYDRAKLEVVSECMAAAGALEWNAWHPDGRQIASVTPRGELFLWDAMTGERLETLQKYSQNRGNMIQISNDGRYLALNNWEQYLRIFDLQSRQSVLETNARGTTLNFNKDDKVLVADLQLDHIGAFDFHPVKHESTILDMNGQQFPIANCQVCLEHNGRWLLIPSSTGVAFIDTQSQRTQFELPIPNNRPIGWFADGSFILTTGADGVLRWPVDTSIDKTIRIGPPKQILAQEAIGVWATDRSGNLLTGGLNTSVAVLIDQLHSSIEKLDEGDFRSGSVSPSGQWLAAGTHGVPSRTRIWRRDSSQLVEQFTLSLGTTLQFSQEEMWFLAIDKGIHQWTLGQWDRSVKISDQSTQGCMSMDSKILAVGMTNNQIDLIELTSGDSLLKLTSPDASRLQPLTFSHDGSRLYALGRDTGFVYSFDLKAIEAELHAFGFGKQTPWLIDQDSTSGHRATPLNLPANSEFHFEVNLGGYENWRLASRPFRKGNQEYAKGNYREAIELYRQAVDLRPGCSEYENNLAWGLALFGTVEDRQAAVKHARIATQNAPFVANNWNTLACVLWLNGEFDECWTAITRSISEKKGVPDPFDRLIRIAALHGTGQVDQAQVEWKAISSSKEIADLIQTDTEFRKLFELAQTLFGRKTE